MKEMRNILGWLGMQEQHQVMQDARKHVEQAFATVTSFETAMRAFIGGDIQARMTAIQAVRDGERQADILKAKMIEELTRDFVLPVERDDLVDFAKTLDRIADRTNSAAKMLGFVEETPPDSVLKNLSLATEIIVRSVGHLRAAIESTIRNDLNNTLEHCRSVAQCEHDADDQKKALIEAIIHVEMKPATMMILYHLAENLEGITDRINDAADFVKALALKSR